MTRARISMLVASASILTLTACANPDTYGAAPDEDPRRNTKNGALIGAGLGALTGILAGDDAKERKKGALVGAALGAGAGALIGNQLDKQAADLREQLSSDGVTINNTGDRLIVTLPQDITFATDSASVRPDLQRDIRAVAENLQAYPDTSVQVLGHTDNTGDAGYNLDLSQRRAQSVAGILIAEGVSSGRVQTFGRGEDQPIASNLTPEGRQQNRRVEIVILPNS